MTKRERIIEKMYHDIAIIQDAFRIYPEEKDVWDSDNEVMRKKYINNLSEMI